jgi:hypothetical protein
MIVVQDSNPGGEVKMRLKNRREGVAEVKDTEILTDMDISTGDIVWKQGAVLTRVGGSRYD